MMSALTLLTADYSDSSNDSPSRRAEDCKNEATAGDASDRSNRRPDEDGTSVASSASLPSPMAPQRHEETDVVAGSKRRRMRKRLSDKRSRLVSYGEDESNVNVSLSHSSSVGGSGGSAGESDAQNSSDSESDTQREALPPLNGFCDDTTMRSVISEADERSTLHIDNNVGGSPQLNTSAVNADSPPVDFGQLPGMQPGVAGPVEPCSVQLQSQVDRLYRQRLEHNYDLNQVIQSKKSFRNPSIYEKLIQFCDIDEHGTNFSPDSPLNDFARFTSAAYYDVLAKAQNQDMERRERALKEQQKSAADANRHTAPTAAVLKLTLYSTEFSRQPCLVSDSVATALHLTADGGDIIEIVQSTSNVQQTTVRPTSTSLPPDIVAGGDEVGVGHQGTNPAVAAVIGGADIRPIAKQPTADKLAFNFDCSCRTCVARPRLCLQVTMVLYCLDPRFILYPLDGNQQMTQESVKLPSAATQPLATDTLYVAQSVADLFGLSNFSTVFVRKVANADVTLAVELVELTFGEQYLGRSEMWRIKRLLTGTCIHVEQTVEFCGGLAKLKVIELWRKQQTARYGVVTEDTRIVFRSPTAAIYLFIQMSEEMWHFDADGYLYYEKAVDGFLNELFDLWAEAESSHDVTIVLFARLFYDIVRLADAANVDEATFNKAVVADLGDCVHASGRRVAGVDACVYFEDFYSVVVQNERFDDWKPVLLELHKIFATYRETLMQQHKKRMKSNSDQLAADGGPLFTVAGCRISSAERGNFLEAFNMALNTFENTYLNRNIDRTGQQSVVISAGSGVFEANQQLAAMTKQRVIDCGVGSDLICVGAQPFHAVPLLKFVKSAGADVEYSLPHWINISFYSPERVRNQDINKFKSRIKVPNEILLSTARHTMSTDEWVDDDNNDAGSGVGGEGGGGGGSNVDTSISLVPLIATVDDISGATITPRIRCARAVLPGYGGAILDRLPRINRSDSQDDDDEYDDGYEVEDEGGVDPFDAYDDAVLCSGFPTLSTPLSTLQQQQTQSSLLKKPRPSLIGVRRSGDASHGQKHVPQAVNPFDLKYSSLKATPNRRRWTHIYPPAPSPPSLTEAKEVRDKVQSDRGCQPTQPRRPILIDGTTKSVHHHHQQQSTRHPFYSVDEHVADAAANDDDDNNNVYSRLVLPAKAATRHGATNHKAQKDALGRTLSSSGSPKGQLGVVNGTTIMSATAAPTTATTTDVESVAAAAVASSSATAYHYQSTVDGLVDWKSLIKPASLPLTTDYFPAATAFTRNYAVTEYELDPAEVIDTMLLPPAVGQSAESICHFLTARQVFEELISQRLAQGFQIIVVPSPDDNNDAAVYSGLAHLDQLIKTSVYNKRTAYKRPTTRGSSTNIYWLSIGQIFHRIMMSDDEKRIWVVTFKPGVRSIAGAADIGPIYRRRTSGGGSPDSDPLGASWSAATEAAGVSCESPPGVGLNAANDRRDSASGACLSSSWHDETRTASSSSQSMAGYRLGSSTASATEASSQAIMSYKYRFRTPDDVGRNSDHYQWSWCIFRRDNWQLFNWNQVDYYVMTRGDAEYPLTDSLKYWRLRLFVVPVAPFAGATRQILCAIRSADERRPARPALQSTLRPVIHDGIRCDVYPDVEACRDPPSSSAATYDGAFVRIVEYCFNRLRRVSPGSDDGCETSDSASECKSDTCRRCSDSDDMAAVDNASLVASMLCSCAKCGLTFVVPTKDATDGGQSMDRHLARRRPPWLPPHTFVASTALDWVQKRRRADDGQSASEVMQSLLHDGLIRHASLLPASKSADTKRVTSETPQRPHYEDMAAYWTDWVEVEVIEGEPTAVTFRTSLLDVDVSRLFGPSPPPSSHSAVPSSSPSSSPPAASTTTTSTATATSPRPTSDRSEWAHLVCQSAYASAPPTAFQVHLNWLVASGCAIRELVTYWCRKVHALTPAVVDGGSGSAASFTMFPAPRNAFALPINPTTDPVRGPIFIDVAVEWDEFVSTTDGVTAAVVRQKWAAFRAKLARRFGFVPYVDRVAADGGVISDTDTVDNVVVPDDESCDNQHLVSRGQRILASARLPSTRDVKFVHVTGNMFLLAPHFHRGAAAGWSQQRTRKLPGFVWSWNFMISRRWRIRSSASTPSATGDIAFQDHMLADFRRLCNDHEGRLRAELDRFVANC